jgi:hypothetical protein
MFLSNSPSDCHRQFEEKYWKLRRDPTDAEKDHLFNMGGGYGFVDWFSSLVVFYLLCYVHLLVRRVVLIHRTLVVLNL